MSDIYRDLAASVLGKPAEDVTREERGRAKQGFWACFREVSMLPGNRHLRAREPEAPESDTVP